MSYASMNLFSLSLPLLYSCSVYKYTCLKYLYLKQILEFENQLSRLDFLIFTKVFGTWKAKETENFNVI